MGTLSSILAYEAARGLSVTELPVRTPLTETTGARLDELPLVVPVLRAGLGLLPGMLEHLPGAPTAFVGVKRNETTLVPEPYLDTVSEGLDGIEAWVLDPMLATGGSLNHAAELLRRRGAERVTALCVLAAPKESPPCAGRGQSVTSLLRRLTTTSTTMRSSCPGWATPATGCTARPDV